MLFSSSAAAFGSLAAVSAHGTLTLPVSSLPNSHGTDWDGDGQFLPTLGGDSYGRDHTWLPGEAGLCQRKNPSGSDQACPWSKPGDAYITSSCGRWFGGSGDSVCEKLNMPFDQKTSSQQWCDGKKYLSKFGGNPRVTKWPADSVQEVAWSILAQHYGGVAYRLCPVDSVGEDVGPDGATEKCFQEGQLRFATNESCLRCAAWPDGSNDRCEVANTITDSRGNQWRELVEHSGGGKDFCKDPQHNQPDSGSRHTYHVVDKVHIPDLPSGKYVLSFRWDAKQTPQIWLACTEIEITSSFGKLDNSTVV